MHMTALYAWFTYGPDLGVSLPSSTLPHTLTCPTCPSSFHPGLTYVLSWDCRRATKTSSSRLPAVPPLHQVQLALLVAPPPLRQPLPAEHSERSFQPAADRRRIGATKPASDCLKVCCESMWSRRCLKDFAHVEAASGRSVGMHAA